MAIRLSRSEYNAIAGSRRANPRKAGPVRSDDAIDEVYIKAVEALRYLQGLNSASRDTGKVGLRMDFPSDRRQDVDNLAKGILDSLQGIIYEDDKQVVSIQANKGENLLGGIS